MTTEKFSDDDYGIGSGVDGSRQHTAAPAITVLIALAAEPEW